MKISNYLAKLDSHGKLKIAGLNIPENEKGSIRKALISFQNRIGVSEQELDEEFQEWMSRLPQRLEEENCIVCFQKWSTKDSISICPFCRNGGHEGHFRDWINSKPQCPLCRETLSMSNLITFNQKID